MYKFTDRQVDGRRTTGDKNSSLELSAQVSYKVCLLKEYDSLLFERETLGDIYIGSHMVCDMIFIQ
jgi:hypothetical protein